jgi:hypothetical protein
MAIDLDKLVAERFPKKDDAPPADPPKNDPPRRRASDKRDAERTAQKGGFESFLESIKPNNDPPADPPKNDPPADPPKNEPEPKPKDNPPQATHPWFRPIGGRKS